MGQVFNFAHLDILQNGHDKDIQMGIPPSNYRAYHFSPRRIRRPEYPQQSISRDHGTILSSVRRSLGVVVALWPRCRQRWIGDAE